MAITKYEVKFPEDYEDQEEELEQEEEVDEEEILEELDAEQL